MPHEFTIIIERDPESDWLIGSVAELPGCYTQAPTLAKLEANMREAIQVYIETLDEQEAQGPLPTRWPDRCNSRSWKTGDCTPPLTQDHP